MWNLLFNGIEFTLIVGPVLLLIAWILSPVFRQKKSPQKSATVRKANVRVPLFKEGEYPVFMTQKEFEDYWAKLVQNTTKFNDKEAYAAMCSVLAAAFGTTMITGEIDVALIGILSVMKLTGTLGGQLGWFTPEEVKLGDEPLEELRKGFQDQLPVDRAEAPKEPVAAGHIF